MQLQQSIGIEGHCKGFQTELDFVKKNGILTPVDTGIIVPGTMFKKKNTIANALVYNLSASLGPNATDKALDSLFSANGTKASVGAGQAGNDGIVEGTYGLPQVDHILQTTLNAGGTEAQNWIEYYGYIDGAVTLDSYISIGHNYSNAGDGRLTTYFSNVVISQSVAANRRYHHYWKFTIAIT